MVFWLYLHKLCQQSFHWEGKVDISELASSGPGICLPIFLHSEDQPSKWPELAKGPKPSTERSGNLITVIPKKFK